MFVCDIKYFYNFILILCCYFEKLKTSYKKEQFNFLGYGKCGS